MPTRKIGRALSVPQKEGADHPTIGVNDLAIRLISDLNRWLPSKMNAEAPASRTGPNRVSVETDGLKLLLRPALQVDNGYAFTVAGIQGDEAVFRKIDVLRWLVDRALEYRVPMFAWECAYGDEADCARGLGATEFTPDDFITATEVVGAAIDRLKTMPQRPAYLCFHVATVDP